VINGFPKWVENRMQTTALLFRCRSRKSAKKIGSSLAQGGVYISTATRKIPMRLPPECHESFPLGRAEGFAVGLPLLASARGACLSIVADGRTGADRRLPQWVE
jgi:glycosyltransferase involved in cell wall biosynthesis